jgi:predicted TIM-barrel fold metal-dependent hydrolase
MPRVIDGNQHLWHQSWQPEKRLWGAALRAAKRSNPPRDPASIRPRVGVGFMDPSGDLNVKINDRLGFDLSVMHVVDYGLGDGQEALASIDEINLGTAQAARNHPDRLVWFCNVDPRRPDAPALVEKYLKHEGAKGIGEFYPPQGFFPWEECCFPIYELCIKYDVPINAHTQSGLKWAEPIHWADVCRRYPDLKVIMEHTGVEGPYITTYGFEQAMVVASKHENVYVNTTEWYIWGCMQDVPHTVKMLRRMRDVCGAERIINGTDNPTGKDGSDRGDGEWMLLMRNLATIGKWFGFTFTQAEVDEMLGGAMERLLKLPPKD